MRGEGLHGHDVAAQHAQVVDLVDHVEQDGAAPGLAAPGAFLEIGVRLVEQGRAGHGHQAAQPPLGDEGRGPRHDRAVGAVVAHQHAGAAALGQRGQALCLGHGGGDGLFQQDGQARMHALRRLRGMQAVGRGQHHGVGPVMGDQLAQVAPQRHSGPLGKLPGCGRRVHDGGQAAIRLGPDGGDMGLADRAGAGHGNAKRVQLCHGMPPQKRCSTPSCTPLMVRPLTSSADVKLGFMPPEAASLKPALRSFFNCSATA